MPEQTTQTQTRIFEGLNYSLGNEDCRVEASLLREDSEHVVSVAISGSQLIPFLAKRPKAITLVDMSKAQLSLARLRLDRLQSLSFDEYVRYFGYPPHDSHDSPLYAGKWERTAIKLSRVYRAVLGKKALELFECDTLDEQREFVAKHIPHWRFKFIRILAATLASGVLLLKPNEFPPGVKPAHFFREYERIFAELLTKVPAKENFFLQMLFLGKIMHASANPPEAQREVFASAKAWASQCDIRFVHADAIAYMRESRINADFVALSNISSYFLGDLSCNYLQEIRPSLENGAQVVVRNFLHKAQALDLDGFEDLSHSARDVLDKECTRVYTMSLFRFGKPMRTLRASLIGTAPYQAPPVAGMVWVLSVTLEDGSTAYVLSDVDGLKAQYRCSMTSAFLKWIPGTQLSVDVVTVSKVQLITRIEKVCASKLKICEDCNELERLRNISLGSANSIMELVQDLKRLHSDLKVSEFEPREEYLIRSRVKLNEFVPGTALPQNRGAYDAAVFILCNECHAEWLLGYNHERSVPGWYKGREGFAYKSNDAA